MNEIVEDLVLYNCREPGPLQSGKVWEDKDENLIFPKHFTQRDEGPSGIGSDFDDESELNQLRGLIGLSVLPLHPLLRALLAPFWGPNWGTRQKFDDMVGKKIILHLLTTSIHVANTPHR